MEGPAPFHDPDHDEPEAATDAVPKPISPAVQGRARPGWDEEDTEEMKIVELEPKRNDGWARAKGTPPWTGRRWRFRTRAVDVLPLPDLAAAFVVT